MEKNKEQKENQKASTSTGESSQAVQPMSAPIFKLNIDCTDEICDYLSLDDIHSLGQTCKAMQQVCGEYFRLNYSAANVVCQLSRGFITHTKPDDFRNLQGLPINSFSKFIQNISIFKNYRRDRFLNDDHRDLSELRYVASNVGDTMKKLQLSKHKLMPNKIESIRRFLHNIEELILVNIFIDGNLYGNFLKHCPNLKRLSIDDPYHMIGNGWLKPYPMLEHFEFSRGKGCPNHLNFNALKVFFNKNSNIRSLALNAVLFFENLNTINESNLKLDILAINIERSSEFNELLCRALNKFQANGLYKRLHLYFTYDKCSINTSIQSLHALEKLYVHSLDMPFGCHSLGMPPLPNLREIVLNETGSVNVNTLANNLVNLERIDLKSVAFTDIRIFIQRCAKLKIIRIKELYKGSNFDGNAINLRTLDRERENLSGARKLILYVDETIYLPTKWTMKDISFNFIDIKRYDSYKMDQYFVHDLY